MSIQPPGWDPAWEIESDLEEERSTPIAPLTERAEHVVIGTPAEISPDTFRRKWDVKREPYVTPVHPTPLVARKIVDYALSRTKAGKITGVHVLDPPEITLPPGAKKMITVLHDLPGWGLIVSYSSGWEMKANGDVKQKIIWSTTATEDGQEKRVKVGEEMPEANDNVLVRGYAENEAGLVFLSGQWINGRWQQGHCVVMPNIRRTKIGWQPSKAKERAQGQRNASEVPTLSEWLALAPTMDVKPDVPEWPPRPGMMY